MNCPKRKVMNPRVLKDETKQLLDALPDMAGRARLLATYLSLCEAHIFGYKTDSFMRCKKNVRDSVFRKLTTNSAISRDFDQPGEREWLAGYYFNNALLRIVFLAEISLKSVFKKRMSMYPPKRDYKWLVNWHENLRLWLTAWRLTRN
jgi:hypothetical protein